MKKFTHLVAVAAVALAAASPAAAQQSRYGASSQDEQARFDAARQRFDREYDLFQQALDRYRNSRPTRWDGPPPRGSTYDSGSPYDDDPNYDPARDYRSGNYQERVLGADDRVYRGDDGRYYCRRPDGTTGLIVGAAAGGLFGNVIAGRRSSTVGTLLGAIAGGALGSSVQRNQQEVRCR